MAEYDTFIHGEFQDIPQDQEIEGIVRDLTPGKKKYKCLCAKFMVSKDPAKYPDTLWVRLGRGQLVPEPCSVKILEVFDPVSGN